MKRMREIRRESGIAIEKCASSAGVTVQCWLRYECLASEPSWEMACRIADVLGVSLDALAGRVPPQQSREAIKAIGVLVTVLYAVALALLEPGGLATLDFGNLLPLVVEAVPVLVGGYVATYQDVFKTAPKKASVTTRPHSGLPPSPWADSGTPAN